MEYKVLDHGYIKLIESWGSDEQIIEAARMSTAKGFLGWGTPEKPGDEKLLKFLWEHKHHTPFEMGGLTIEVKAPIFVFREWHRHRVPFSYNEMSARYVPLPDENYIPNPLNLLERSRAAAETKNRQASGTGKIVDNVQMHVQLARLESFYTVAQHMYEELLEAGWPKEMARVVVPVGRYSRMRASANLRGWLNFVTLRAAPQAQWEIRQYAEQLTTFIADRFPRTWQIFQESNDAKG